MKNTKEKVAYGNSVANSYRKSKFFKNLSLVGSLSFVAWKGILLGGQQDFNWGHITQYLIFERLDAIW